MDTISRPPLTTDSPPPPPNRPPRGRAIWLVLGTLLGIGGVWWGTLTVVGQVAHEEHDEEHRYPAAGITELSIANDNGLVEVVGTSTETITVRSHITEGLSSPRDRQQVVGGRLELDGHCPGLVFNWCTVAYRIEVPAEVAVRINNDGGSVRLANLTGELTIDADSGDITASGLRSSTVKATTDSGDVRLTFVAAPQEVVATTDSGDVEVTVPGDRSSYAVTSGTDSGSVHNDLPTDPASPRTITARTDSGDVNLRLGA